MAAPKPPMNTPEPSHQMDLAQLEYEMKLLQLQDMKRAVAEREEAANQLELSRQAGIQATKDAMRKQASKQAFCAHLKENGRSHLAGQRDNNGVVHLLCQSCQKHFTGTQIPPHLMPLPETVGGPQ